MTTPIKIIAVVGPCGARMDFVAGWLGTLPSFVQSQWGIDPLRRQSTSQIQNTLNLQYPTDLFGFLESHRYRLDPDANLTFATKSHTIDPLVYSLTTDQSVRLCYVDITDADALTLAWECVIKTYLRPTLTGWHVDSRLSPGCDNQQRIQEIDQQIKNYLTYLKHHHVNETPECEHVKLNYVELFAPGGSRYFCEKTHISADPAYHDFYDLMLPLCQTPDQMCIWEHVFNKKDYVTD